MVPSRRATSGPKRLRIARSPGVPGATTSRASRSASTIGTPASRKRLGDVALAGGDAARERNLPDHIADFPVALMLRRRHRIPSTMATVSGPTPPGTGVIAPATSSTSGCTSPTSTLPFVGELRALAAALREDSLDLGLRRQRVDADVDDGGARLDEIRASRSRAGRSPRPECRPSAPPPAGPPCANGRSSPWHRDAAAASPSACRRCRCGR